VELDALDVSVADSTITVDVAYRLAGTEETRVLRFQRQVEGP
jgi:hypothetical protein